MTWEKSLEQIAEALMLSENTLLEVYALRARLAAIEKIVAEQAKSADLWNPQPDPSEAYLQRALRRLHRASKGRT
jgi:hypothetical protein